ncbi:MAG: response regulator [Candidatus Marinimicrobia bacterium]|nr:response regulator [Candidatus Neomarinimicrobiota bacterium]
MAKDINILIVDDDPEILLSTSKVVQKAGYRVRKTTNGEDALKIVKESFPDIILLDNILQNTTGIKLCQKIKSDPKNQNILIIISSGTKIASKDQAEGLESGADGYITRPISNRELLARVNSFARIYKAERMLRKSEKKYRKITENIAEGVITLDRNFEIKYSNSVFYDIVGYSEKELLGINFNKILNNQGCDSLIDKDVSDQNAICRCETQLKHKKGKIIDVGLTFSIVLDDNGDLERVIGIVRDISEIVRIREKYEDLLEKVPDIEDFIVICANCKNIRTDNDKWITPEEYFANKIDSQFSHGICPNCIEKLYPEYWKRKQEKEK